jgi:cytochrome c biogenesis protein CcmG/thiol:disulfide interchange protein DsbE
MTFTSGASGRSRLVLWVCLSVAVALAVLVAVLATSGPASEVSGGSPLIGRPAPTIDGPNLLGGPSVSLAAYSGKWVLVNFAASWCAPCRQELPQLSTFERDHAATGNAGILTVAYDPDDLSDLASLMRSSRATWPTINDGQAVVDYGVRGLPESYLVDPQGIVVAKYLGDIVASQLNAVIGQLAGATT